MPVRERQRLIAIIDDDEDVRQAIRDLMRALGFAAEVFSSAEDFLRSSHAGRAACLIADVNMPGMSGLDLCHHLSEGGRAIPTILITAYPTADLRSLALAAGAVRFLTKPFLEADLIEGVQVALGQDRS
ncbi:response regulator [Bradyrhizobium sp. ISRA442]|uniref:response regulator transcription factor n=1 Tax=Bradyrhizobium sp. ISRA442 TaxID=2866197 RepID=UPI00311AE231